MKTKHMGLSITMAALITIIAAAAALLFTFYSDNRVNYDVIKIIKDRQKSPGVFIDMDEQVGVKDYTDLGYLLKESKIELHYGVQTIDIPYKSLDNMEWMDALSSIGIKVYRRVNDETGETEYRITYWDEVIEEWSKYI